MNSDISKIIYTESTSRNSEASKLHTEVLDDEKLVLIAARIINQHKAAFEKLAGQ